MNNDTHNADDEIDDDVTLGAAPSALDEIRAESARVQGKGDGFDPNGDPTRVINLDPDLAEEPTVIRNFEPIDDPTTVVFDPTDDPTTVMDQPTSRTLEPRPEPKMVAERAPAMASLIDGKAPPATSATYWDHNELAQATLAETTRGKGPIPPWFLVTSLMAVLMACGLVLLVMWALSGSVA